VRENVRKMLRGEPRTFETLSEALRYAKTKLTVPLEKWVKQSFLLRRCLFQRKLTEFWSEGK
jgi:hypothetical protein